MEVDDEYEWMEEASYKPVDGPLPVSKRQQQKGLGPSVYTVGNKTIWMFGRFGLCIEYII